jgi:hypothetical protein
LHLEVKTKKVAQMLSVSKFRTMVISRSLHLGETRYYITADVHSWAFTSAIIQFYRMQWPTTVLVFPLFPTLLWLIKKRAAPDPHAIATSYIYYSSSPSIYSMGNIQI